MKILIVKLSSLGDIVHASPMINALHAKYPDAEIDWLVYKPFAELLKFQKHIHKVKILKGKKVSDYSEIVNKLKKENYDLIIDLQGLMKTAFLSFMIAVNSKSSGDDIDGSLTNGTRIIGFANPRERLANIFYTETVDVGSSLNNSSHVIEKNLAMANHLGAELNGELDYGKLTDPEASFTKARGYCVCLIPGTTWESKHWLAKNWAATIEYLINSKKSTVYIIGTQENKEHVKEIYSCLGKDLEKSDKLVNLLGKNKLSELPALFKKMDLILGVDTGPLHLAAATVDKSKTKILGIYGPTSAARTGPYGFDALSVDEFYDLRASHKRTYAEDNQSISLISPKTLINQLEKLKI